MRLRHRPLLALLTIPSLAMLAACGSSSNKNNGTPDASVSAPDASTNDAAAVDGATPGKDASTVTDAPAVTDALVVTDAPVNTTCPAVDAAGFTAGKMGPLPTMTYGGGGILSKPQMVTFTFTDTYGAAQLAAFGNMVTGTPYFAATSKDYCDPGADACVQTGIAGKSFAMDAAAGASTYIDTNFGPSDAGIDLATFMEAQIQAAITAGTLTGPDSNALYSFYFPSTATVSMGDPSMGGTSCGFGGYHNAMLYGDSGVVIAYAINMDCAGTNDQAAIDGLTVTASHELLEAVSDPYGGSGWYLDQHFYNPDAGLTHPTTAQVRNEPWGLTWSYGEIGDNCENLPNSGTVFLDGGYAVQRIWSVTAAAAGKNPCVPVPAGETYINTSTDKVLYVAEVGVPFTVNVTGYSDGPIASWYTTAHDRTRNVNPDGGARQPLLSLQFAGGTMLNGYTYALCVNNNVTEQLTVTLLADPEADPSLNPALDPNAQPDWPQADAILYSLANTNKVSGTNLPLGVWPFAVITPKTAAKLGIGDAGVLDAKQVAELRHRHRGLPADVTKVRVIDTRN